jgi:two-component system NtrC family response regulator
VVAATNRNLAGDAQKGSFRQDLYFRLAVLSVTLPSLRERAEDVPTIAETLARRIHPAVRITPEAMAVLQAYRWPGNVRELRNVLTRAYVMGGPLIEPDALEFQAQEAPISSSKNQLEEAEREVVVDAMRRCGKNKSQVARMLGIPRTTLVYKLQRWGLED